MIQLDTSIQKVDKIFHLADVHIRNLKRHDEYQEVFNRLEKYIRENKTDNSIIFLGGDIVHSKLEMSPELVNMTAAFLKQMADIAPTILILGNHDKLARASRLDALSPIVDMLNHPQLYFLKENGFYKFAQIGFNHMEVYTPTSEYKNPAELTTELKIALFHGTVTNSANDFGHTFENAKMDVENFIGHHLALLGDIHTRQFLQHYEEEEIEIEEEDLEKYLAEGWAIM